MKTKLLSAGLLMYRIKDGKLEFFLTHPGGPFFRKKGNCWGIPKGGIEEGEEDLAAAIREFTVETCLDPEIFGNKFISLGEIKQRSNKMVRAWAFEGDCPADYKVISINFEMEWPPRSGKKQCFPEIDRGMFLTYDEAREKMIQTQLTFLERLAERLNLPLL
jgi:predicted NUDIX family NTP pyrophosphohydrolase